MSPEMPQDAELLRRYREAGDREALSLLFERHQALAYRVALRVLRNPADAEDAAQNALVKLLAHAGRWHTDGSLAGLVAHMSLQAARDLARSSGRRCAREAAAAVPGRQPDALDTLERRETQEMVRRAVDALEEPYRLAVLFRYFDGLSTGETAQALGISGPAARMRLSRAVGKMRRHFRREGILLTVPALAALLARDEAGAAPATLAARAAAAAPRAAVPAAAPAVAGIAAKLAAAGLVLLVAAGGSTALRRLPPPPPAGAAGPGAAGSRPPAPVAASGTTAPALHPDPQGGSAGASPSPVRPAAALGSGGRGSRRAVPGGARTTGSGHRPQALPGAVATPQRARAPQDHTPPDEPTGTATRAGPQEAPRRLRRVAEAAAGGAPARRPAGEPTAAGIPVATFDAVPLGKVPEGWKLRGTNGYASGMVVEECEVEGRKRHCLQIVYDFEAKANAAGMIPGAKTVIAGTWLKLPENTRGLRVTLDGNGSKHRLVAGVGEPKEWFNFEGPIVDWQGWKSVEIDLGEEFRDCGGPGSNGRVEPPLWFCSLNLCQNPNGPAKGIVRLLSVEAVTVATSPVDQVDLSLGGAGETGVVPLPEVDGVTLKLCNRGQTAARGTLAWQVQPFEGRPAGGELPCALGAGETKEWPLPGLPARCSYYDIRAELRDGGAARRERLAVVVAPPAGPTAKGRFGAGVVGTWAIPASEARRWAEGLRRLGAAWTAVELTSDTACPQPGVLKLDQFEGVVRDVSAAGLRWAGFVNELSRLRRADEAAGLAEYLPLVEAASLRAPGSLGWLPPFVSPPGAALQPALAARLRAAEGRPATLIRAQLSRFLTETPAARTAAIREVAALLGSPDMAGLALLTGGFGEQGSVTDAQQQGLQQVLTEWKPPFPVWFLNIRANGKPSPNLQPSRKELLSLQARATAMALLRWASLARPQDPIHYQTLTDQGMDTGLFAGLGTPKPSAAAFATLAHLLREARPGDCEVQAGYRLQRFSTPEGPVLAVWPAWPPPSSRAVPAVSGKARPAALPLRVTGPAWRIHYLGARDPLARGDAQLPIGPDPVYVQGEFVVLPPG